MTAPRILIVAGDSFGAERLDAARAGREPRVDFVEMAGYLRGDLLTFDSLRQPESGAPQVYSHLVAKQPMLPAAPAPIKRRRSLYVALAREAFRVSANYDIVILTGEDLGIPYAALRRLHGSTARVIMVAHYLNPAKKALLLREKLLGSQIDKFVTYSPIQHLFAVERLRIPASRVELVPFHADARFYSPDPAVKRDPHLVVAAGFERRDYATLFEAVEGTGIRLELGVGSPWSRFRRALPPLPEGTVNRFRTRAELRDLYRRAAAVVVPLVETEFQAGISVALEAMACGAPVILTRTSGLSHLLRHGTDGWYIAPGDAEELRRALTMLLRLPDTGASMGAAARSRIEWAMTTEHFLARFEELCRAVMSPNPGPEFHILPNLLPGAASAVSAEVV